VLIRTLVLSLALALLASAGVGCGTGSNDDKVGVLETTYGRIVIEFLPEYAPKHTEAFKKMFDENFFENVKFHRVIPNRVIQGGDPNSKDADRGNDGMGSAGYNIDAEFNANKHLRGTVSMARAQDPNSASCQFFICVKPQSFLDGKYSVFGQVVEGMDVVDKIVAVPRDARDNPLDKVVMEKVTIEKRKL
jgi:peptidyl-prolyl cis-trans isomerase B (cyclophilin B)